MTLPSTTPSTPDAPSLPWPRSTRPSGVAEAPVAFRVRQGGCSSIGGRTAFYYALTVILALLVDRARAVNPRLVRQTLIGELTR